MSLTYTDIFCGAGGSSIGLTEAGLKLKLAANHWDRAIATHSANFPDSEHLCADVSNYDMRRLPSTDVLWASPECTWHSPAGGRKRLRNQLDLLDDYVPTDGGIRSRATAFDVIRAAEVHAYRAIIVENVVEFADWPLFGWWLDGLRQLGYHPQIISVSSAHVGGDGNPHAPQWRDRIYVFLTGKGVPVPDVRPRPLAWCPDCDELVNAVQSWNPGRWIGKYGVQYRYRCPNVQCRNTVVEPFVAPAATAIDWSDLGTRIGDRKRPLAPATMRRIRAGLELFAQPSIVVNRTHGRTRSIDEPLAPLTTGRNHALVAPFAVNTNHSGDGVVTPEPWLTVLRRHADVQGLDQPIPTLAAGGMHHALTVPPGAFIQKHHGGLDYNPIGHMTKSVDEPLPGVVARPNLSLVIPYRKGHAKTTDEPLHTLGTKESAALVGPAVAVHDCRFRMLKPREHLRAQRFPDSYTVTGNQGEQTMQAGNAVSSNVAHWLGTKVMEALA